MKEVSVAALYRGDDYLLQLRSDVPHIDYPNTWGCFGGQIEEGETPRQALYREVREETGLELGEAKYLGYFQERNKNILHVFSSDVSALPLEKIVVTEGQGHCFASYAEMESRCVPHLTRAILLADRLHRMRAGKRVVMCHGTFDWLHHGHLEHLEQAKRMGDILVVSVVADQFSEKRRPLQNEDWRCRMLEALRIVDFVVLTERVGPHDHIKLYRPDIYVRGPDYVDRRMPENEVTDALGIKCAFTYSTLGMSTTHLKLAQGR